MTSPEPRDDRNTAGRILIAFLCLAVLVLVPLFSVDLPPLVDYPNHLARMYVLADGGHTPALAEYYRITWELLPNLAMDVIVPWLVKIMPLMLAGKLFLAFMVVMTAGGLVVLHRTIWGRWSLWPCLGFGLLYNKIFILGFINFLFGLGAGLWVAVLWLATRRMQPVVRLVLLTIASTLVFFCHIEAQGLMFFMLAGLEAPLIGGELKRRHLGAALWRLLCLGLPFVPAAAIFLASWQHHAGGGYELSPASEKLAQLMTVFGNYHPGFDILCSVVFLLLFVAGGLMGRVRAAPALVWWLVVLIAIYILMPNTLFTGASADHRIPLFVAMLLVAGTDTKPQAGREGRGLATAVLLACLALFVMRIGLIEQVWLKSRAIYADEMTTLSQIAPASRMAVADPWAILQDTDIPPTHVPLMAVPLRQAFVPPIFAYPAQQPLRIREPWATLESETKPDRIWAAFVEGDPAERARLAPLLPRYDYVLFVYLKPFAVRPDPCLQFMRGAANFQLYRVIPRNGTCPAS